MANCEITKVDGIWRCEHKMCGVASGDEEFVKEMQDIFEKRIEEAAKRTTRVYEDVSTAQKFD